jgi:DNA-binding NarL/FixJ family response regulator
VFERDRPSLLIVDHTATRVGIRLAVEDVASMCLEAASAEEAIRTAAEAQPDVCIVGSDIAGGAIPAVDGICQSSPGTGVIVLAASPSVAELIASLRAGAVGYVPSSIEPAALRRVFIAVARGEGSLPRAMLPELARELRMSGERREGLSAREAEVLAMVRNGQSTAVIADHLAISPITVRRHISVLMQKTGVRTRAQLATPRPTPDVAPLRAPVRTAGP